MHISSCLHILPFCFHFFIGSVMQAERINLDSNVFPNKDLSAVDHRIGEFATQCGYIFLHLLLKQTSRKPSVRRS
jgi:hypothetical protein